jgi:hypothetical protein
MHFVRHSALAYLGIVSIIDRGSGFRWGRDGANPDGPIHWRASAATVIPSEHVQLMFVNKHHESLAVVFPDLFSKQWCWD